MDGSRSEPDAVDRVLEQWERHVPEVDASPMAVFIRLHRDFLRYQAQVARVLADHGVNMATFSVLAALRRSGPPYRLTVGELAETALVTSGGSTQRVDRLEASGLVSRVRDERDARVVHVQLTERGTGVIDRLAGAHFANERHMLAGLTVSEQRDLAELLRKLERSLEASETRREARGGSANEASNPVPATR